MESRAIVAVSLDPGEQDSRGTVSRMRRDEREGYTVTSKIWVLNQNVID